MKSMVVHFYEVGVCICDNVNNRPVLVATQNVPVSILTKYQFVQAEDGRWIHFLTRPEYDYVMKGYPDNDVLFGRAPERYPAEPQGQKDIKAGKKLSIAGFICYAASFLFPIGSSALLSAFSNTQNQQEISKGMLWLCQGLSSVGSLCGLAAFILMIILRIRFKDNLGGKILMWIYIVTAILAVLGMIALVAVCGACAGGCEDFITELHSCD